MPPPSHQPTAWIWACRALRLLTLGARGHRWVTYSYQPVRRYCPRCGSLEGPPW